MEAYVKFLSDGVRAKIRAEGSKSWNGKEWIRLSNIRARRKEGPRKQDE